MKQDIKRIGIVGSLALLCSWGTPDSWAGQLLPGQPPPTVARVESKRGQIFDCRGVLLSPAGKKNDRRAAVSSLISAIVGTVNDNGNGTSGIQKAYDGVLGPAAAPGAELSPGADLYLTIDTVIQTVLEREVQTVVQKHQPLAVYIVMAEPQTGAILAMAQYPAVSPQKAILVAGFEPGSIMKAISIAGALDAGIVTLDTAIDCESGKWMYAGHELRDSGHRYDTLEVRNIVQKSSNIGTAKIAVMLGDMRLDKVLTDFGVRQTTGIELEKESSGICRSLDKWDELSTSRFAIGQGFLVTPLQMVRAYCGLANGGMMPQLHLADHIKASGTGTVRPVAVAPARQVLKPEAVALITSAMKLVTQEGGTGPKAAVAGYEVAGMTGTAQKVVNGEYSATQYVASFIGYVPADKPAFVLLVTVDEPTKDGYYGGIVAAPAFSRIATQVLKMKRETRGTPP